MDTKFLRLFEVYGHAYYYGFFPFFSVKFHGFGKRKDIDCGKQFADRGVVELGDAVYFVCLGSSLDQNERSCGKTAHFVVISLRAVVSSLHAFVEGSLKTVDQFFGARSVTGIEAIFIVFLTLSGKAQISSHKRIEKRYPASAVGSGVKKLDGDFVRVVGDPDKRVT